MRGRGHGSPRLAEWTRFVQPTHRAWRTCLFVAFAFLGSAQAVAPQTLSHRGFVEGRGYWYPETAPNDTRTEVADFLAREEIFVKPVPWFQLAAGFDIRANSYEQVDQSWDTLDWRDRGALRPAISLRRLSGNLRHGPLTVDVGKQFIRWGKTDIVTPTDYLAPRDFLNVVGGDELLGVTGARVVIASSAYSLDAAWVPFFTPSRTPLLTQRWTAVPPSAADFTLVDRGSELPRRAQGGIRLAHTGRGLEYSVSYFHGFSNVPAVDIRPGSEPVQLEVVKTYPALRSYGVDLAVATRWLTIKGEATYSTSPDATADEFAIYVIQLERQVGEWLFLGGYVGEVVHIRRTPFVFAPDRGLTRTAVARASYTIDANRSLALEVAARGTGDGVYGRGEYSQAIGAHWRATAAGVIVRGRDGDFLGQYRRNSHASVALRYSF